MNISILSSIQEYFVNMEFSNFLDIFIVVILFCIAIRIVSKSRALMLITGIVVLMVIFGIAKMFHLPITTYIWEKIVFFFVVASAVLLAPDVRRVLERIGSIFYWRKGSKLSKAEIDDVLDSTRDTVANLSRRKVGALIVFEQNSSLEETIASGIKLDAYISSGLLINIFEKNTPLHDGAVVVRENKVMAATCYLPLSEQHLSKDLGTRHRAAIGLSEQCDALIVVVSEETGDISVAREGQLLRYLTPNDVEAILVENLYKTKNKVDLMKVVSKSYN